MEQENQQQQQKTQTDTSGEETPAQKLSQSSQLKWLDKILPSFTKLQTWWDQILGKVRSWLPGSVSNQLNDLALTGIISALFVVLLLTTVLILPAKKKEAVDLSPPQATAAPLKLTAPKPPEILETVAPLPPQFSPEQNLVASVQQKVVSMTDEYAQDLIKSVEADFSSNSLIVRVDDSWYQLDDSGQNQLAQAMFHHSQQLDFHKLEIKDSQGNMLARNPVVGKKMVILLREHS